MSRIHLGKHLETLTRYGVTLPEWFVLSLIGDWPMPAEAVAATASSCSEGDPRGRVSVEVCQEALAACILKEWLTVVSHHTLQEIESFLEEQPAIGPVYGLPEAGDVDFTVVGAQLFQDIDRELFGSLLRQRAYSIAKLEGKQRLYSPTKKGALLGVAEIRQRYNVVSVSDPIPVGAWRIYWWQRYPKGYCIELEFCG